MRSLNGRRGFLVVAAVGALAGCSGAPVVGVLRPASGEAQAYGEAVGNGIEIALATSDDRITLPEGFAVIDVDTGSDPERAAAEFRRLVDEEEVRFVVGGMSPGEARALLPLVNETQVVCLSPTAAITDIARQSRYFYRLFATDEAEGRTAARHLHDRAGVRRVLVYTDQSSWTRGVEAEFRQHFEMALNGKVVGTIDLGSKIWRHRSVDALHSQDPDAVYVVGHAENILTVLQHLADTKYEGVSATTSAFYLSDVVSRGGALVEGVLFPLSAYDAESLRDPVPEFVESYRGRFGQDPDIFAAHGFDAMRVAMHAMAATPAVYSAELKKVMSFELHDFPGVTGAISFDEHGDVRRYPVMHTVFRGQVMACEKVLEMKRRALADALAQIHTAGSPARAEVHAFRL